MKRSLLICRCILVTVFVLAPIQSIAADVVIKFATGAAGDHIAAYKLPKVFVFVDEITRSPSGKADYRWARDTALSVLNRASPAGPRAR